MAKKLQNILFYIYLELNRKNFFWGGGDLYKTGMKRNDNLWQNLMLTRVEI